MSRLALFLRDIVTRLPGGRQLNAELKRMQRQRDSLRRRLEVLRLRVKAARRDAAVLEHVLPLRHAALRVLHTGRNLDVEAAFAARSDAYRSVLGVITGHAAATDLPSGFECVSAGGLSWWLPSRTSGSGGISQRLADKRQLPLREILETRDLAIGRVMLDIGANVGTTSITRVVLGDFDRVYAAEPDHGNYACLVRNVVANDVRGLIMPDRVAIGDSDGEMTLRRLHSGTHHLVVRASDVAESERLVVPCVTLDTWVRRFGIDLFEVAFIKSDTQGWDIRVLAGASGVLAHKHIAWQVEFSPAMLQRAGGSLAEAYESMEAHFTHFIDLRGDSGARVRRTSELRDALAYVEAGRRRYTNVLLYNAAK